MISVSITPIYMALTALIMVVLATRAALSRGKYRVAIGDGGIEKMSVLVRGFGNLIEYAPAIILLLFFMELSGIEALWLHLFGGFFIFCRIIHPIALFGQGGVTKWKQLGRQVSAGGTLILLLVGAITLLVKAM